MGQEKKKSTSERKCKDQGTAFIYFLCLHPGGSMSYELVPLTIPRCLWQSFERCFRYCSEVFQPLQMCLCSCYFCFCHTSTWLCPQPEWLSPSLAPEIWLWSIAQIVMIWQPQRMLPDVYLSVTNLIRGPQVSCVCVALVPGHRYSLLNAPLGLLRKLASCVKNLNLIFQPIYLALQIPKPNS